jgi:hypothetical protein
MSEAGQTTHDTIPPPVAPPPPPEDEKRWITRDEEDDLRWYFRFGVGRLEAPSNMIDQLERSEFWFRHARPCRKCGGKHLRISRDGVVLQEEIGGSGFITSTDEWRKKAALARLLDRAVELPVDPVCGNCKGKGWVEGGPKRARGPITAHPTGSSVKGNGAPETGGNDSLERLGRLDRLLAQLRRRRPDAYPVLEAYYCPAGVERGLSALWWMTPSGKKMLKGRGDTTERQHFENLSNAQERKPDPNRALQFSAADKQAKELLEEARDIWTSLLDREPGQ